MFKDLNEFTEKTYGKKLENHKKKQTCVKCGHKTMQRHGEDLNKAKCFHPKCGLYLNLDVINGNVDYTIIAAERFATKAHEHLFTKDQTGQPIQPFIYANKTRKISENILKRSDVGAIPLDYDVKKENEDLINELEQKIKDESDTGRKEKLQNRLNELLEFLIKLQKFTNDNYNRFVFFYRDEKELITQFKTRKPYADTKTFRILKVQSKAGIFNARLFSPDELPSKKHKKLAEKMLIVEGEFDQLTFANWGLKHLIPIQSCALGGANGDIETVLKLSDKQCVLYDNDEAGRSVLEKAKELRSIRAITTPEPYKDIDEYINSFKNDKACRNAVVDLLNSAKFYHREFDGIRKQIRAVMKLPDVKILDRNQAVADIVINEFLQRGKFIQDNNYPYFFPDDSKHIIPLVNNNEEFRILLNRMGVNAAKDFYPFVAEELRTFCRTNGLKIETYNSCHYDSKNFAIYLFNNDSIVYKITAANIETLENGDEGVLFNYRPEHEPFEFVETDENQDYFKEYVLDYMNLDESGILSPDEQKELLRTWTMATFFNSIMPSKVILAAIGEKGSGKTSTLRRLGIILYGSKYNVAPLPTKADDFDALITNSHLVILDNVDTGTPWLNDKLASVSTGQTIQKRELYSDMKLLKFDTKTFIGVTSRTPQFTRDDVADRLICINFKRIKDEKGDDSFIPENDLIQGVLDNRNQIISYIMLELQKILKALEETKDRSYRTKFRIADFAKFGLRINDVMGRKEEFANILDKVCQTQKDFAVEEDSLVYALKIFAKKQIKPHKMSGFELHKQLLFLANEDNFDIPEFRVKYKSVKSLTRRIANIKGNISNDVKITVYKERANQKSYKIELMDKDFELPPTNDSLFDKAMKKAQNIVSTDKGGRDE